MKYELAELPYNYSALEPHISEATVKVHYEKHHQGYVDKLNKSKFGDATNSKTLENIIRTESGGDFNNAAQVWNHDFYWQSLTPNGGGKLTNTFIPVVSDHFGSVDKCKEELLDAAKGQFGSGWAWLVLNTNNKLEVLSTTDAENPLQKNLTPLLTIDVWEHAYYLDYMNQRDKYLEAIIDNLLNWKIAEQRYFDAVNKISQ